MEYVESDWGAGGPPAMSEAKRASRLLFAAPAAGHSGCF
mgnify:CR=1 FL=1